MYTIHTKQEVSTLRVFKGGESYENRDSPILSCTVHYISDTEVYICNASGALSKTLLRVLCKDLFNSGYRIIRYERDNKIKLINLAEKLDGNR